ncbi:MAG TPA: excalibur calcium-binding domain-containing protein [Acidimicrobiia bacterium]|nr:excalibur calcium-binding domain-containing protein [Acidimicrobiia bacterium]
MRRYSRILVTLALIMGSGSAALAANGSGSFVDDDDNIHEGNIEAIAAEAITRGCNPPANHYFCPDEEVNRGQMAAFIRRALRLPAPVRDHFIDDTGHVFEVDINALADAGITRGCDPPDNFRFCPYDRVSRGQMAAFLRRAFDHPASGSDRFIDDDSSVFEDDIDAIAAAGVTAGCNPPDNDRFCPAETVRRDQMTSFLARALDLTPIPPGVPSNPGDAVNCTTFESWQEAQDWFDLYAPHYGDVADLDGNGDGAACESLPGAP